MNRHGFLLIELLVGIVMLGILATTLVLIVHGAARTSTRASQFLSADRALLSLRGFMEQELRDARDSDVTLLSPTRLAMYRPIGEAAACADSGGVVLIPDASWAGTRAPQGGRDEAWLLVDAVAARWQQLPIDSAGRSNCPLDGAPATRLDVAVHAGVAAAVRVMEPVELRAYASGGADWFGLTPASRLSTVQPFAGPLVPSTARFTGFVDHLDIAVPPRGGPVTTVQIPLGNLP